MDNARMRQRAEVAMKDLRPGAGQAMTELLRAYGDVVGLLEAITTWAGSTLGPVASCR